MSRSELALLMQRLGAAVDELDPRDVKLVLNNKAFMSIVVTPVAKESQGVSSRQDAVHQGEAEHIAARLEASLSREQGAALLKALNKPQLLGLAKYISVSIDTSATKERLIEKIVERKVGLRLRQDAFAQAMHLN